MEAGENIRKWQKQVNIPPFKDNQQFSDNIRDTLGLMGYTLPWEVIKDSTGFRFMVSNFGKDYTIKVPNKENIVSVEEKRKGFWQVFNSLHFLGGEIPGAPALINTWRFYQYTTVFVILFSIVSGIYIFLGRKNERKAGMIILFCCLGFSLLIMLSAWW